MANSLSAKKRVRQTVHRRSHNMRLRTRLRTHIKNVVKAVQSGNKEEAIALYKKAVPVIDSSANKKLIHKNKAARHKSRLNRLLQKSQ